MPRFHVSDTFELPDRRLFVMAGSIVEGEIRKGMFVYIPFNSSLGTTVRIHSIELARRQDREVVCLCVESEPELAQLLRDLNIADETFEVTADGSECR
jgi:hypothetical protein